ncbi:MAG TPA: hypothetical protein VH969_19680 [Actinophytocola sp.]|uniref:hypothetical protein n=1 Tax=Actinophytocola sp. TaxID=1872138 RepID=UPI002F92B41E
MRCSCSSCGTTPAARRSSVHYSGCEGRGTDDGRTRHRLTAGVRQPLLTGPHTPDGVPGAIGKLAWP